MSITPSPGPQWVQDPSGQWHSVTATERATATGAFVCSLVGTIVGLIPLFFLIAWVLGLIGLILGISAARRTPRPRLARAALVLGIAAVTLGTIGFVIVDNAFS